MSAADDVVRAWNSRNLDLKQNMHADRAEHYPAGSSSELAASLLAHGYLYALNTAVLHPLGFALGVNTLDSEPGEGVKAAGLFLMATADPEGWTFEELDHRAGLDKISDKALSQITSRTAEVHARFARELERRTELARYDEARDIRTVEGA